MVTRDLPRLAIAAGDEDWFQVQAKGTGTLTVTATQAGPGDSVRLELLDASGTTVLATGSPVKDAAGQVTGQLLTFPDHKGQTFLVRVLPGSQAATGMPARYTLDVAMPRMDGWSVPTCVRTNFLVAHPGRTRIPASTIKPNTENLALRMNLPPSWIRR